MDAEKGTKIESEPVRWRITLTAVIWAVNEQEAREEVAVLHFGDVENIKSIEKCGEEGK